MNIYNSTKVLPYVYICVHKETEQFYIGYREDNKVPSSEDLPKYKTSSKIVKDNFDNYTWQIIAEFFTGNDAYDFEQSLIFENWNDPNILNKNCHYNKKKRFKAIKGIKKPAGFGAQISNRMLGKPPGPQSAEHIEKRAKSLRSRQVPESQRKIYSAAQTKRFLGSPDSTATKKRKSDAHKGTYIIESPDGRIWVTDQGLKDFAELYKNELTVTYWQLFNAYRKCYNKLSTYKKRKDNNTWKVTRLDKLNN